MVRARPTEARATRTRWVPPGVAPTVHEKVVAVQEETFTGQSTPPIWTAVPAGSGAGVEAGNVADPRTHAASVSHSVSV